MKNKRNLRKAVCVSMHPEDIKLLEDMAAVTGLTKSELIKRMLYKISFDTKMQDIIRKGFITSHNVRSDSGKKGKPDDHGRAGTGQVSSSLEPIDYIKQSDGSYQVITDDMWEIYHKWFCGAYVDDEDLEIALMIDRHVVTLNAKGRQ